MLGVRTALGRSASTLTGRAARLRFVYIVLGGALFMPYYLVSLWVMQVSSLPLHLHPVWLAEFAAYLGAVPLVAVTAPAGPVRQLEVPTARVLLGGRSATLVSGPAVSWRSRGRAGVWYLLHLAGGALLSGVTLATVPLAGVLLVLPAFSSIPTPVRWLWPAGWSTGWAPPLALGLLLALLVVLAAASAAAYRVAPVLLGPTPAERLAEVERRTADLAERGRLARELHDSVGHALSVVAIQANAAGQVADRDPEFVRQALRAIGETASSALADLDHVLGLLRDEPPGTAPQPTLADLGRLLGTAGAAGLKVTAELEGDLKAVPAVASREAYRVVQEGLTNALRHAGQVPVRVRVAHEADGLAIGISNPVAGETLPAAGGGRGLRGIRERTALLGGRTQVGRQGEDWIVSVEIPL
jgi:signal transduction histidine kinase